MKLDFTEFENKAIEAINKAKNSEELEKLRVKYLGRKSELVLFLRGLKDKSKEELVKFGRLANDLKKRIELEIHKKKDSLKAEELEEKIEKEKIDITAPGRKVAAGHLHPLTLVLREIIDIFNQMGFYVVEGPEVETEYYNFDALRIPEGHPARDLQDTFWLKPDETKSRVGFAQSDSQGESDSGLKKANSKKQKPKLLLRTQTSPMQVRFMEKHNPPFRIIVPGRIFRREATDRTHEMQFYQLEGLMVDRHISFANLKGISEYFFRQLFHKDIEVRFVQSYFPFVEPGVEILIKRNKEWLEVAGAGMVHQEVFKNAGYVPGEWQGFAFGMGIDRLAMIKYKINDIRLLYSGDLRFLKQF